MTNVNVNIDSNIRELAAQILARMGLDQQTAIEMFYRQIIAERKLPWKSVSLDEQIITAIRKRNTPKVRLETDANGNVTLDKEKYPELYDWVVNG